MEFIFDWICHDIGYELSIIDEFYAHYHLNLNDMKRKSIESIEGELKGIDDPEEYSGMFNSYENHYEELFDKIFPNQMNYMMIVNLYTFLERNITKICYDYKEKNKLPFSIEAFEGDLGTKFKRYLICYNKPIYKDKYIQTIQEIATLRNNIVHCNGHLTSEEQKIKRYIKDKGVNGSIFLDGSQIIIKKEFCDEYRIKVREIIFSILKDLGYETELRIIK